MNNPYEETAETLRDFLRREGYVRCDSPACACGSYHGRFGLHERWQKVKDALAEADHPLTNANGNTVLRALGELVADRDRLRAALVEVRSRAKILDSAMLLDVIRIVDAAIGRDAVPASEGLDEDPVVTALRYAVGGLRIVGDDYPDSSCHDWCHKRADEALVMAGLLAPDDGSGDWSKRNG